MSKLLWIAITSVLWCLPFPLARADGPPTADGQAAALVKQLQDRSFKVRERASRELINMGPAAVPALRRRCKDTDPDVRRRCQAILPLALKRDQDRLLKQLLADKDGSVNYDLPGRWDKSAGR